MPTQHRLVGSLAKLEDDTIPRVCEGQDKAEKVPLGRLGLNKHNT